MHKGTQTECSASFGWFAVSQMSMKVIQTKKNATTCKELLDSLQVWLRKNSKFLALKEYYHYHY